MLLAKKNKPGHTIASAFCGKLRRKRFRNRVPDWGKKRFEKKGHRAFIKLELVSLAKLLKNEVDFASNHGAMPRQAKESLRLKLSVWQSWV